MQKWLAYAYPVDAQKVYIFLQKCENIGHGHHVYTTPIIPQNEQNSANY